MHKDVSRALSHPLRGRIVDALQGDDASVQDLAEYFGETPSLVAFHTAELYKLGCLEVTRDFRPRTATTAL